MTAKQRRRRNRLELLRVECCCEKCRPHGTRWPSHYVGNGLGAEYLDDVGRLVAGISYEDFLEGNPLYVSRYVPEGSSRSTSSPSAAAIAELEARGQRVTGQEIKTNKADERETKRAYRQAFKEGWRFIEGEWIRTGELAPQLAA